LTPPRLLIILCFFGFGFFDLIFLFLFFWIFILFFGSGNFFSSPSFCELLSNFRSSVNK